MTPAPESAALREKVARAIREWVLHQHKTALDVADEVLALVREHDAARGWQPIETAPKDGTKIDLWVKNHLAFNKPSRRVVNCYWGRVTDWLRTERDDWVGASSEDDEPTHWMPCPLPPPPAPPSAPSIRSEEP